MEQDGEEGYLDDYQPRRQARKPRPSPPRVRTEEEAEYLIDVREEGHPDDWMIVQDRYEKELDRLGGSRD